MDDESGKIVEYEGDTGGLLAKTFTALAEGLTGIAASERQNIMLSVGHVLQALRKGRFLNEFRDEWNGYRDKGRIDEGYEDTEQHYACLQELLSFLDNDLADEERFGLLKKILLVAATEEVTDRTSILPRSI